MPGAGKAEIFFIAAMMILTLIFSIAACYIFFRQLRKESRQKRDRKAAKSAAKENSTKG